MAFTEICLDKISRVTQNPSLWYTPKRLWRYWLKQLYSVGLYKIPATPVLRNWDGKASLHLRTGDFSTRRLWFHGYVQYNEEFFLRTFLRQGMTVIDVGANIGLISATCGLRVGRSGAVHSFEPLGSTFEVLEKNISANGLEGIVAANRMAVSAKSGEVVKLDYCDLHSGLTHLSVGRSENRDGWHLGSEQVMTVCLDEYVVSHHIQRVDLLKIDVEGAELLVMDGAHETLQSHRPTILCEFNNEAHEQFGGSSRQLWEKWMDYGYTLFDYNHRARKLRRSRGAPEYGAPTYIGTTDPEWLAKHIGARIV